MTSLKLTIIISGCYNSVFLYKKRLVAVETDEIDTSTETESLMENTPKTMSDYEVETLPSVSGMSEEVARQIKAVTDPLFQQIAHPSELKQEIRNEQMNRRHNDTTSSRSASS